MDSKTAIAHLTNDSHTSHQHGLECLNFRELRDREWEIIVEHTFREGNHATYYSLGYGYPSGSHKV
ncbi:hypothetical protein LINPERHAP1_LOCUS36856 [Linum perenne]